jgi:2-amino-4-hydroxy-6-hydroxymethyldihydropteridine diphosphokinase
MRFASKIYRTEARGGVTRKTFLNQAVVLDTCFSTAVILRKIKLLERRAGRRVSVSRRWDARPLDIDIIDHAGRVSGNWMRHSSATRGKVPPSLILPHPSVHLRAFVLIPVVEIMPHWWHPALRVSGKQLLHALPAADLRSVLECRTCSCDGET